MNKLKIKRFKAFEEEITIPLDGKNLLMYGENGAGKSSIYECIKVVFFHQKLDSHITATTPEDMIQKKSDFWSKLNNKISGQDFEIEINDDRYDVFDKSNHQTFMVSLDEIKSSERLLLKDLIGRFLFEIDDINSFCSDAFDVIQGEVNNILVSFNESVSIVIDEEDNFAVKIIDARKNLESKSELKKYFNEAKINTVILLIILNVILLIKDNAKKRILVLDDFITSLDSSNRTFLVKYVLEKFIDFQIIILTHNISFYNLIMFIVNNISDVQNKWCFGNIYEINNNHKIYIKSGIDRVKQIKEDYSAMALPLGNGDLESIGNRIRKKFEILLYEYSKLLMIGSVEDSNKIIERIMKDKAAYFKDGYTAVDLIDSLERMLQQNNLLNLQSRLQDKINDYKKHDFANFQKIINELKLYQKVTMHPMSHGIAGMPTFTKREIKMSIDLLEKMEEFLKNMVDTNVSAV
jgi:energy-coupling factor transporter ATP-binding protein EcfA2